MSLLGREGRRWVPRVGKLQNRCGRSGRTVLGVPRSSDAIVRHSQGREGEIPLFDEPADGLIKIGVVRRLPWT
jgi:hypothetical protein